MRGEGFYFHFIHFPWLEFLTLCRFLLYKFFIGTGNLRTRGHFKHPGPAQMPVVLPSMLWPCCVGPHRPAHLSRLPSWISPPLPTARSFLGTATAPKEVRSTAPPPASHGGLSSREDGSERQEEQEAHPGPLASLPAWATLPVGCPQHLLLPGWAPPPVGPRRVRWKNPHKLCRPRPGVLAWPVTGGGPPDPSCQP